MEIEESRSMLQKQRQNTMSLKKRDILLSIIVILLFGFAMIPFCMRQEMIARSSTMGQCGKDIYIALLRSEIDDRYGYKSLTCVVNTARYTNSTELFSDFILKKGIKKEGGLFGSDSGDFSFFDLSAGITPIASHISVFSETNNFWTIVKNCPTNEIFNLPILFTRNLDAATFALQYDPVRDTNITVSVNKKSKYSNVRAGVIVYAGGRVSPLVDFHKGKKWSIIYFNKPLRFDTKIFDLKYLTPTEEVTPDIGQ